METSLWNASNSKDQVARRGSNEASSATSWIQACWEEKRARAISLQFKFKIKGAKSVKTLSR